MSLLKTHYVLCDFAVYFVFFFVLRMMMVCPYIHLCALICKQHLVSLFPHLLLSVQLLSFDVAPDGAQGRRRRGAPSSAGAFWAPPCSTRHLTPPPALYLCKAGEEEIYQSQQRNKIPPPRPNRNRRIRVTGAVRKIYLYPSCSLLLSSSLLYIKSNPNSTVCCCLLLCAVVIIVIIVGVIVVVVSKHIKNTLKTY